MKNVKIVVQHGEAQSLFFVVDCDAPESEQPAVMAVCYSREQADKTRRDIIEVFG